MLINVASTQVWPGDGETGSDVYSGMVEEPPALLLYREAIYETASTK